MNSLLRFDLSAIPATATVTSAKLTLYNTRAAANGASDVVNLDKVLSAWTDSWTGSMGVPTTAASGVTCPSVASYTLAPTTPEAFVVTGMDALVQGWVTNPSNNNGFMLSTSSNLNIRFASSEYATAQYRPALEVTYTTSGGGDTTPPTVTTTAPPATSSTSPITVSGTASDNVGIAQVTWSNGATGANGVATGTTSWTASIPLASGANTITITAVDAAGNPTTTTFTVTYTGGAATTAAAGGGGGGHKTCGIGAVGENPGAGAIA